MQKKQLLKLSKVQQEAVTDCYGRRIYKYIKQCSCGDWFGTDVKTKLMVCHLCGNWISQRRKKLISVTTKE